MKKTEKIIWNKKGVVINPQNQLHFIDHLAVIAIIMDIPYLTFDQECYVIAKKYYPGLNVIFDEDHIFSRNYLVERYDVSFLSDLYSRIEMKKQFAPLEQQYGKIWRNVHVPHGFSDKTFYLEKSALEDILLLYGQNMIDLLKYSGKWENVNQYVVTGNYRYSYYLEHIDFYKKVFEEEVLARFDKKRPLILYAPTWLDSEQSTSFFEAYHYILSHLPNDYNIIVKLHPRLELDDIVNYHRIIGEFEKKSNILFLAKFPLVFPILDNTDIYIGDMSSIGYDFLPFDKPLFLLNRQNLDIHTDRRLFLFRCATEIRPDDYTKLYPIIEKNLSHEPEKFSTLRRQMWNYTFGEQQKSFADIKAEIIQACEL